MISTRDRIVAAAIELLGDEGVRSCTHRRIDRRAGLPAGSTSNYFRTREALLAGAVEGIVASELTHAGADLPADIDGLVESLGELVEFTTGPRRTQTRARHALFLEAAHDADLRARLSSSREHYVALVSAALVGLGATDPAAGTAAVMGVCEGIILHRIARGDDGDPRPAIAVTVRGAVGTA